jgi:hypothetical protein
MQPGLPEPATHDYKRHGTSSLYAALDISTGQVIGRLHARHRAVEFKPFLQTLDREVPRDLDVHVILDNSSAHKTPAIRKWVTAYPRFVLHFTPSSSYCTRINESGHSGSSTKVVPETPGCRHRPRASGLKNAALATGAQGTASRRASTGDAPIIVRSARRRRPRRLRR